jgi:hypothetical protein
VRGEYSVLPSASSMISVCPLLSICYLVSAVFCAQSVLHMLFALCHVCALSTVLLLFRHFCCLLNYLSVCPHLNIQLMSPPPTPLPPPFLYDQLNITHCLSYTRCSTPCHCQPLVSSPLNLFPVPHTMCSLLSPLDPRTPPIHGALCSPQ